MKSAALHRPLVILEDRYGGMYSRGRFLAISRGDQLEFGTMRAAACLSAGPSGSDGEAALFWDNPPDWIAAGETPDEAMANLLMKSPPVGRDGRPLTGVCPFGHGVAAAPAAVAPKS